jgi:hypothetical protein
MPSFRDRKIAAAFSSSTFGRPSDLPCARARVRPAWMRVPGVYKLAPAKSPEASPAPQLDPPGVRGNGHSADEWLDALERWAVDPSSLYGG